MFVGEYMKRCWRASDRAARRDGSFIGEPHPCVLVAAFVSPSRVTVPTNPAVRTPWALSWFCFFLAWPTLAWLFRARWTVASICWARFDSKVANRASRLEATFTGDVLFWWWMTSLLARSA